MNYEDLTRALYDRVLPALGLDPALALQGFRAEHSFPVAIRFTSGGYRCFPEIDKKGAIKRWQLLASADPAMLVRWAWKFKQADFSMLTGRENGVVILDYDGEAGCKTLEELEKRLGTLPPTWRVSSGKPNSGHIWLKPPPGSDDLRNQQPIKVDGVRYKLDVRGWHGHGVLAGARHSSGRRYKWQPNSAPDEVELAECPPSWWAFLPKKEFFKSQSARPHRTSTARSRIVRQHDPSSFRIGDGEEYGGFNKPIFASICSYFRKFGVDADAEELKDALKSRIRDAPQFHDRSSDEIERYASDDYLDAEIESARKLISID